MPHIDATNIACGFHAGDPATMRETVGHAVEHGVNIGAHVSVPDLWGFGRRRMALSPEEVRDYCTFQIGALWEAFSKKTGEAFLAGSVDDPSLPEPLPVALFGGDTEGYRVAWRRPQRRDDFGPAIRSSRSDYTQGGGEGGFGDSTAGKDGALAGAGADLDDDVPF